MIRKSNNEQERIQKLASLIPVEQVATYKVDEAAALSLGLNRTDLRCLGMVMDKGSISASALAEVVGLTRGAMTTVIDRLEKAGYVQRADDRDDRRGTKIEATAQAKKVIAEIWGPIRKEGFALLESYSDEEIEIIIRFFEGMINLQNKHVQRIRKLKN